jgi:glycosyltransferase involved in cell wall biosynthesis
MDDMLGTDQPKVLMLRIEPTGYMLALVKALRAIWPGELDVVFMSPALTQKWDLESIDFQYEILPDGRWQSARAMLHRIKQTQPSLLHVAGWSAPPSLVGILHGHGCGLPVVVDLDTWRGAPSFWRSAIKKLVYPSLFSRIGHFAPGGSRQADYLRGYGVPDEKITPVQMTVDVIGIQRYLASEPSSGSFFRKRLGIALDAPVALFMGRLVSLKGIADLLHAWPSVTSRVPGIQLVIAGDGEERGQVVAAAAKDPNIHAVGRLTGNDVWSAYAAADLCVAPSLIEPWGLVVNEAMAAGTPVIVTDIFGCVGDLARDGETALVVPAGAPDKLAEAISAIALDETLRLRIARTAASLISAWTIQKQAQKIASIWMQMLDAKRR